MMVASTDVVTARLSLRADLADSRRAGEWLEDVARSARIPVDQRRRLDHCLDEALANIIAHGGTAARGEPIDLTFTLCHFGDAITATVTIQDSGEFFDPCLVPQRHGRPVTLNDAEPGGLGLLMIRTFSDELRYHRCDGRNQLTFAVHWTEDVD